MDHSLPAVPCWFLDLLASLAVLYYYNVSWYETNGLREASADEATEY
jgi:hypothetical protein